MSNTLVSKVAAIMATIEPMYKAEQAGSGSYGYKFISVNAMIDIARPRLAEAGIVFYGDVENLDRYDKLGKNGNQTFIYLKVRWHITDGENEFSFATIGEAQDTGDKASNKAYTAAQKQAISKLLMMSGTDDDPDRDISPQDAPRDRGENHPAVVAAKERKSAMDRAVVLLKKIEPASDKWAALINEQFPQFEGKGSGDLSKQEWESIEEWADTIVNAQTSTPEE